MIQYLRANLPLPDSTSISNNVNIGAALTYFDDDDEWVYSRCFLADFNEFDDEEAA